MRKQYGRRSGKALAYLLIAVLGGIGGAAAVRVLERGAFQPSGPVRPYIEVVESGRPAALGEPIVQVVKRVGPAVIRIDTTIGSRDPFNAFMGEQRAGEGSGFIINSRDRLAITNNHVVEDAQRILVTLPDKRTLPAEVVGTDPIGDIALVRLGGNGTLPEELKFGDSDRLEIGQILVAIGNPLGFENSVTQGVLSATGRRLEGRMNGIPMEDLIQTDAAINP
ncbi:MAG TPA: trypsin-like peptidase domain-containing protein, partial [Armatimonadota bacterium]|nr:trypsin-like peptidase domain-containing protein [Armatimonadota bacterium]